MATVTTDSRHYTDIADAIRAKGVSGSFLPAQMADAIASIEGGGGGIDIKSATRCEIVTVGANTVDVATDALAYFGYSGSFPGVVVILLDAPSVNNQFGFFACRKNTTPTSTSGIPWWRWQNGANYPSTFSSSWSAYLVEGSKYLVIEW